MTAGCGEDLKRRIKAVPKKNQRRLYTIWANQPRALWQKTDEVTRCLTVEGVDWIPDPERDMLKPSDLKLRFEDEGLYEEDVMPRERQRDQLSVEISEDDEEQSDEQEFDGQSVRAAVPTTGGKRKPPSKRQEFAATKRLRISQPGLTIRGPHQAPDFTRHKKDRPPKPKIVPDTKNKMKLRQLKARNASEEEISRVEEAIEKDEKREKAQKEREAAARKAKSDKKKQDVLQTIQKRADDCIDPNWNAKKACIDESWEKVPKGSMAWYQMHLVIRNQDWSNLQSIMLQNQQNKAQRVEMSEQYQALKEDLAKVTAEKGEAEQKATKAEQALRDVKKQARLDKGQMLAMKAVADDQAKRYGENLLTLEEFKEEHKVLNQTLEAYEKENKALKEERDAVMTARAESEAFEKDSRETLLRVRQGFSTEVAEELAQRREEMNALRKENDRLKNSFKNEVKVGDAYHELAKAFKKELAAEKAKSQLLTEQNQTLLKQNQGRDLLEEKAVRVQNRRYGTIVNFGPGFLNQSLLKFNHTALQTVHNQTLQFVENMIGGLVESLRQYVFSEAERIFEKPDLEKIKEVLMKKAEEDATESAEGMRLEAELAEQQRTLKALEIERAKHRKALEDAKAAALEAQTEINKLEESLIQAQGLDLETFKEVVKSETRGKEAQIEPAEPLEELEEGEIQEGKEKQKEEGLEPAKADEEMGEKDDKEEENHDEDDDKKSDDNKDDKNDNKDDKGDDDDKGGSAGAVQADPEKPDPSEPKADQGNPPEIETGTADEPSTPDKSSGTQHKDEGEAEQHRRVWTQSPEDKAEFSNKLTATAAEITKRTMEVKNRLADLRETVIKAAQREAEEERNIQRDEEGNVVLDYNDPNDA